jgi:hypothetical protein
MRAQETTEPKCQKPEPENARLGTEPGRGRHVHVAKACSHRLLA